VRSDASTVEEYLAELDDDQGPAVAAVREVVLANLPDGYEETMRWGMISYEVPLERYPDTYNGQPLSYAGLAAQKRYVSLYLSCVYADATRASTFEDRFRATGKKLDMGKSCVRFRRADDLPLELIADVIAGTSVDEFVSLYEKSRG
jgi:Domain of unknown function (DU1801)